MGPGKEPGNWEPTGPLGREDTAVCSISCRSSRLLGQREQTAMAGPNIWKAKAKLE